jgi:hypothetical protein
MFVHNCSQRWAKVTLAEFFFPPTRQFVRHSDDDICDQSAGIITDYPFFGAFFFVEDFSLPLVVKETLLESFDLAGWFSAACTTEDTLSLVVPPASGFDLVLLDLRLLTPFRPIDHSFSRSVFIQYIDVILNLGTRGCGVFRILTDPASHMASSLHRLFTFFN